MEWIIVIFGAGLIELIFQLLKTRYTHGQEFPESDYIIQYFTADQFFLTHSKRWLKYYSFRLLPPIVVFILISSIYDKYFDLDTNLWHVIACAFLSVLFREAYRFIKIEYIVYKLLFLANIVLIVVSAVGIALLSDSLDFSCIAPTLEGVVDNVWATLLIAIIIISYVILTKFEDFEQNIILSETSDPFQHIIISTYLRYKSKYSSTINDACKEYECSPHLLTSILVIEGLNRRWLIRCLEKLIVLVSRKALTIGIAQVRSSFPISDEESIYRAAQLLSGSAKRSVDVETIHKMIYSYNSTQEYVNSVNSIMRITAQYASNNEEDFTETTQTESVSFGNDSTRENVANGNDESSFQSYIFELWRNRSHSLECLCYEWLMQTEYYSQGIQGISFIELIKTSVVELGSFREMGYASAHAKVMVKGNILFDSGVHCTIFIILIYIEDKDGKIRFSLNGIDLYTQYLSGNA